MTAGPRLLVEIAYTEDSSLTTPVIINEATGHIAVDYSKYYERIASSLETIENAVTTEGVNFKDVYASLSYSSLIKVFEEEGIDIDDLISKTQDKLQGL